MLLCTILLCVERYSLTVHRVKLHFSPGGNRVKPGIQGLTQCCSLSSKQLQKGFGWGILTEYTRYTSGHFSTQLPERFSNLYCKFVPKTNRITSKSVKKMLKAPMEKWRWLSKSIKSKQDHQGHNSHWIIFNAWIWSGIAFLAFY